MTQESTVLSLQELCFTHIVVTLEEYTNEKLALLPKRFREQLLHSVSMVDVCRLEATQFISGIDTSSLWEQVYREYIGTNRKVTGDWKINLFMALAHSILGDEYSLRHSHIVFYKDWKNYVARLLALKCDVVNNDKVKTVMNPHPPSFKGISRGRRCLGSHMPLPKPAQTKLLIPARHEKYFLENDQTPNLTALEIIGSKCLFHPKEISISVNTFSRFLESQKYSVDVLATLFQEIETLTIWDEQWKHASNYRRDDTPLKEASSELLRSVLRHNRGKLMALRIKVYRILEMDYFNKPRPFAVSKEVASFQANNPIDSITPILSSSYNRLKEFTLDASGFAFLAIEKLISITEHQSVLDTISITISACICSQLGRVQCRRAPLFWRTPLFSAELLHFWIRSCLQKPFLRHFTLCLDPISAKFFSKILVTFLSISSTQKQTIDLTISRMNCPSDTGSKATFKLHKKNERRRSSLETDKSKATPDTLYTQHKSIELNARDLKLYAKPLLTLRPLKLKQLIIHNRHFGKPWIFCEDDFSFFISKLAWHPDFKMKILEIARVDLSEVTFSDYDSLLKKETLQIVRIVQCIGINTDTIFEVATTHQFHMTVKMETRKDYKKICNILSSDRKAQYMLRTQHLYTVTLTAPTKH